MTSYVMIDGQLSPETKAQIPALDRGFLYGDSLSEVFAAQNGTLIDFERHMQRLRNSARLHDISIPWSDEEIRFDIEHCTSLHPFPYAQIRLVVSRGIGGGLIPPPDLKPKRYLYYKEAERPQYKEGMTGASLKTRRHPHPARGETVKTASYLDAVSQSLQASKEGFDEILWLGADGEFTESAFANVFFICREGDLVEIATPPLGTGILPGVTRGRIIELLTLAKIPVTERVITMEELPRFDEAFLSSSIRLLRPVSLIDKHRLHTTRKNAVYWHILRLYESWLHSGLGSASPATDNRH